MPPLPLGAGARSEHDHNHALQTRAPLPRNASTREPRRSPRVRRLARGSHRAVAVRLGPPRHCAARASGPTPSPSPRATSLSARACGRPRRGGARGGDAAAAARPARARGARRAGRRGASCSRSVCWRPRKRPTRPSRSRRRSWCWPRCSCSATDASGPACSTRSPRGWRRRARRVRGCSGLVCRGGGRRDRGARARRDGRAAHAGGVRRRRQGAAARASARVRVHAPGELGLAAAADLEPHEPARVPRDGPVLRRFAARWRPCAVAIAIEWVVLRRAFRPRSRHAAGRRAAPPLPRRRSPCVALTLAGFVALARSGSTRPGRPRPARWPWSR